MPLEAFYKHAHIELQRLHNTPCYGPELPPFGFGFVRRNNPILHIKQFALVVAIALIIESLITWLE